MKRQLLTSSTKSKRAKSTEVVAILFSVVVFTWWRHKTTTGYSDFPNVIIIHRSLSGQVALKAAPLSFLPQPVTRQLPGLPLTTEATILRLCAFTFLLRSLAERHFHTRRSGGHARTVMCCSAGMLYTYPGRRKAAALQLQARPAHDIHSSWARSREKVPLVKRCFCAPWYVEYVIVQRLVLLSVMSPAEGPCRETVFYDIILLHCITSLQRAAIFYFLFFLWSFPFRKTKTDVSSAFLWRGPWMLCLSSVRYKSLHSLCKVEPPLCKEPASDHRKALWKGHLHCVSKDTHCLLVLYVSPQKV